MNSVEGPLMADTQHGLPSKGNVRKTSVPLSSTRSFFVKKPPQAPQQPQGQETVRVESGSTLRDEQFLEEMEQIRGTQTEGVTFENTYRVTPDPLKKFSSGRLLILSRIVSICDKYHCSSVWCYSVLIWLAVQTRVKGGIISVNHFLVITLMAITTQQIQIFWAPPPPSPPSPPSRDECAILM